MEPVRYSLSHTTLERRRYSAEPPAGELIRSQTFIGVWSSCPANTSPRIWVVEQPSTIVRNSKAAEDCILFCVCTRHSLVCQKDQRSSNARLDSMFSSQSQTQCMKDMFPVVLTAHWQDPTGAGLKGFLLAECRPPRRFGPQEDPLLFTALVVDDIFKNFVPNFYQDYSDATEG